MRCPRRMLRPSFRPRPPKAKADAARCPPAVHPGQASAGGGGSSLAAAVAVRGANDGSGGSFQPPCRRHSNCPLPTRPAGAARPRPSIGCAERCNLSIGETAFLSRPRSLIGAASRGSRHAGCRPGPPAPRCAAMVLLLHLLRRLLEYLGWPPEQVRAGRGGGAMPGGETEGACRWEAPLRVPGGSAPLVRSCLGAWAVPWFSCLHSVLRRQAAFLETRVLGGSRAVGARLSSVVLSGGSVQQLCAALRRYQAKVRYASLLGGFPESRVDASGCSEMRCFSFSSSESC